MNVRDALGYAYLGNRKDRRDNANVEKALLADWLTRQGHGDNVTDKALALGGNKTLYDANREVYGLLRDELNRTPLAHETWRY